MVRKVDQAKIFIQPNMARNEIWAKMATVLHNQTGMSLKLRNDPVRKLAMDKKCAKKQLICNIAVLVRNLRLKL